MRQLQKRTVYLDNAATSYPKPEVVYLAVDEYQRQIGVSSGRGGYFRALKADEIVYQTRTTIAGLFNIKNAARVVFTANATESLNLALKGLLKAGDHVVTTSMEHNAVWRCLKGLEAEKNIKITAVKCSPEGLAVEDVKAAIRSETRLVVMIHVSNVTGTIMPVGEVGRVAHSLGIPLLVDTAQSAGILPIDVERDNIDLLAFTGHKGLLGPFGTGGLYIAESIQLKPLKEGGTGSESRLERQPDTMPERFEAGTVNVAGLAGLGAGVNFLRQKGTQNILQQERELTAYALNVLSQLKSIEIYGSKNHDMQVGVISFNISGMRPEEVGYLLDEEYGIMVRVGLHCSPLTHKTIGTADRGTLRFGLGLFNTIEEIDYAGYALQQIIKQNL